MHFPLLTRLQIAADVHGADVLRQIVEQMEATSRQQETFLKEEREGRVRSRREEVLSKRFSRLD